MSWLVVLISGDATPDIQLAEFDDLFKLATGSDARSVGKCILHVGNLCILAKMRECLRGLTDP